MPSKRDATPTAPVNGALPPGWEHVAPVPPADPYDNPERRALVEEALRLHAAKMAQLDPHEAARDPETAALALDRADYALEAAEAVAAGEPEPFTRGVWVDPVQGPRVNHECVFIGLDDGRKCDMAHLSEQSSWVHSRQCRHRPRRWPAADVIAAMRSYPVAYARRDPDRPLRDPAAAAAALETLRQALADAPTPYPSSTRGGIT